MRKEKIEENLETKFAKENILEAKVFKNRKDIINIIMQDDELLTITEVQERIDKFMKGKVK